MFSLLNLHRISQNQNKRLSKFEMMQAKDQNTCKKLKYKYLDKSLNSSLNKRYQSPQKREKSFNCGRRNTIEDFSPYRNINYEHGIIKQNLMEQITMQNQLLNHQVREYKTIVFRQQQQIISKEQQIKYLKQKNSQDYIMYEGIIANMKQQIRTVLSKNRILEDQIVRVNDFRQHQKQVTQAKHKFTAISQEIISILNSHCKKMMGNLYAQKMDSDEQVIKYLQSLMKRNNTLEQLVKSMCEMHNKIEQKGLQVSELKSLWKWLKLLGQQHNYLKKIRKPLARKLCLDSQKSIQQIIDVALVQHLKIVI